MVFDVTEADFEQRVIERSHQLPVVVDFWAEWCGPCRTLTPALEAAAQRREGDVELAKLDTDANQSIAAAFQIQSIPAVKAFKDGKVAAEFIGAIPPAQVEAFFDELAPSEADHLAESDDEESLRRALELDPTLAPAAYKLGRMLLARGDEAGAVELLDRLNGDFVAEGLAARARLSMDSKDSDESAGIGAAFAAWDEGDHAAALDALQAELADEPDPERRDLLRRVMVALFTELGVDHPLAREHRRRLAASLS
jgi:putative thioredoxin